VSDAPEAAPPITAWRVIVRLLHAAFVVAIVVAIVLPPLPEAIRGTLGTKLSGLEHQLSFKQGWQMYAPDPQRAQLEMNLTAVFADGSERRLEETAAEKYAWGTHWFWNKTRVDIWRQYANFHPDRRNENRTWYLKGVCVREARVGEIPQRIVMYQVRRRFTPPEHVAKGAPGLGTPSRRLVTVQYCKTPEVLEMIEQDREHRGLRDHG
jgi:hypothetical protein